MQEPNTSIEDVLTQESYLVNEATERTKCLLDAKYEPVRLEQIVAVCNHINLKTARTANLENSKTYLMVV